MLSLRYYLWFVPHMVLGVVLIAALQRRLHKQLPFFFVFLVFEILDFFSSLIIAGMLIFLFVFSRALHISWRNRITGVALGFGIMACVNLSTAALRSELGKSGFVAVDITQMAAFHVSVVVWLVYLLLSELMPAFAGRGLSE